MADFALAGAPARLDLFHQLGDHLIFLHFSVDLAVDVDQALAVAGRDADFRTGRFARAVHRATHHGDVDGHAQMRGAPLDFFRDREQVDAIARTGRARDDARRVGLNVQRL